MAPPATKIHSSRSSDDGGAVEELTRAGKRPRGRPPGSKNKAKVPTFLSVDPQDALRSHVMEVSSGAEICSSLSAYARARGRGLAVLHAVGSVAGVSLRQQNQESPPLSLKGKLDLISLSGTLLPDNTVLAPAALTVFLSGPQGQLMAGPVDGTLVAAGTVLVMAATFSTATYEKLPLHAPNGFGPGQHLAPDMEDPRSTGYNMMENGSSSPATAGVLPETSSYAWVHQHNSSNTRPPYICQ